jgi:hypothetical protein
MAPFSSTKLQHWFRTDQVKKWTHWSSTPVARQWLEAEQTPWLEWAWQLKAWRILQDMMQMTDWPAFSVTYRTPRIVVQSAQSLVQRTRRMSQPIPDVLPPLLGRTLHFCFIHGWNPSPSDLFHLIELNEKKVNIPFEHLLLFAKRIPPDATISHADTGFSWIDSHLFHDDALSKQIWEQALAQQPIEVQLLHSDWASFVLLQPELSPVALHRIGEALLSEKLTAPLPPLKHLSTAFKFLEQEGERRPHHRPKIALSDTFSLWQTWCDRQLLREQSATSGKTALKRHVL